MIGTNLIAVLKQKETQTMHAIGVHQLTGVNKSVFKRVGSTLNDSTGCSLYRVANSKGKKVSRLIYQADYISYDESRKKRTLIKIEFCLWWLDVVVFSALLIAGFADVFVRTAVSIIDVFAIVAFLYMTYTLITNLCTPKNKRIFQYAVGSIRLRKSGVLTMGLFGIDLLLMIIFAVFGGNHTYQDIVSMFLQLAVIVGVANIVGTEQGRKVIIVENHFTVPDDADEVIT